MSELVSIITPTFPGREHELLTRSIPSVFNLDWPHVEMVIVSDRNPGFSKKLEAEAGIWQAVTLDNRNVRPNYSRTLRYAFINETWRNPRTEASIGAVPWATGCLMAMGEFVGFLGDDDEYLPDHVSRHVQAMKDAEAMFSVSQVQFTANGDNVFLVGDDSFQHGRLDANGVMCHISALKVANWTANGENAADYRLVRDWKNAGLRGTYVGDGPTAIHHDGWVVGKTGRPDRPQ